MNSWEWPDLSEIRQLRKAAGLTQKQLSEVSGVQQSMISRIEDGKILDPSFTTSRKLFQALQAPRPAKLTESLRARDVMNRNVISVNPHKTAKDAWKIMKARNFDQLPVIDEHGRIHGGITMQSIHDVITRELFQAKVSDLAGDPFPLVGEEASIETLSTLLRLNPAVLVINKGKVTGIVTKYDLIDAFYSRSSALLK